MKLRWRLLLIAIACVSFGIAASYPIRYRMAEQSNASNMQRLYAIRDDAMRSRTPDPVLAADVDAGQAVDSRSAFEEPPLGEADAFMDGQEPEQIEQTAQASSPVRSAAPEQCCAEPTITPVPRAYTQKPLPSPCPTENTERISPSVYSTEAVERTSPVPSSIEDAKITPEPTPDRRARSGALPYPQKEKVQLDSSRILPEYQEILELNPDLIGWLTIPGTEIDYPVVQCDDSDFYLTHDFFGQENQNGQLILDRKCDPYTPSYNLVISGHNMKNGSMFGHLVDYMYESYWDARKVVRLDTLNERREYVVFAAFFSADYDEDETGFRYNVDIQYRIDAEAWLKEIGENRLYDTGIEAEFGDEFLTLTTCNRARRKNGRFVVVCRKIREGEHFE